jgi:hypothetical protein
LTTMLRLRGWKMNKEKLTKEEIDQEIIVLEKQKESIVKKEEIKNQKAFDLSKQLKKLRIVAHKTELAIIETQKELNKLCTHERTREEYRDYAGGYLDRAEHWTDTYCEICGVKINEEVSYGGFA